MNIKLPKRINRLEELAGNLWWSWNNNVRYLFRSLDYPLWRSVNHNPIKLLQEIDPLKLQVASEDYAFLSLYDSVLLSYDSIMSGTKGWYVNEYPELSGQPIAYFSAEFALHNSLPIYAGGLGILAGDLCKEACDLGLPMVAVGFMYPQGYFRQRISNEGWQEEIYQQLDFNQAPIHPVIFNEEGSSVLSIQLQQKPLYFRAWQVKLGLVNMYLLDTSVDQNDSADRLLSARLYAADRDQRVQQEMLLGIGGVKLLQLLNIKPAVWHANEGHTSFMMLERIRELVQSGLPFEKAVAQVKASTVFTTHTPVPAGHDIFSIDVIDKYINGYWIDLGISREKLHELGQSPVSNYSSFNMTILALKLSKYRCGVSKIHGTVTRRMWSELWPETSEEDIPISHVTNGVHFPTWIASELYDLLSKYLGNYLMEQHDDPRIWDRIHEVPDHEFWAARQIVRRKLIHVIVERAQKLWNEKGATAEQVLATGALLDADAMTIGFCRRFTEYKRPALIFHDIERLKKIVTNPLRPVQIIFAGKSHPADNASKHLLQGVYQLAKDRQFLGRIAFVEDYDMHIARYLVQGVDVWLNNPRRLQEASGTSGMKASINGIPNLSVADGWWIEGYNGNNGWTIGEQTVNAKDEDHLDALSLYKLIEDTIVPLYYERDRQDIPHGWIKIAKEAIKSVAPLFSSRRMLKEYTTKMYIPSTSSLK